jgi:hypothetical protein
MANPPADPALDPTRGQRRHDRRWRLAASALDAGVALALLAAAMAVATAWLLLRTDLGRRDAGAGDAVAAVSLVAAAVPAWTAWLAARLWRDAATPGQRRQGLALASAGASPEPVRWRPIARLTLHPLSLPAWLWLALTAALGGVPWLWLMPALVAAIVALAALASLALLLARPQRRAVHDLLARTRLMADGPPR